MARSKFSLQLGERIKEIRLKKGLTLVQLGEKVGVSPAQIQKYENGSNHVLASKLNSLAKALLVEIGDFFTDSTVEFIGNFKHENKDVLELIDEYSKIESKELRSQIYSLVKSLAKNE